METKTEEVVSLDEDVSGDIILVSQDGVEFTVSKKVARLAETIKTPMEGDETATRLDIPNIKSAILAKILEFLKYHVDNPAPPIEKPLKSANMHEVVSQWDANYIDVEQEMLFEIILGANWLDTKPLLDLSCAKVASMIKGKTPEQIRKTFNIVNDFSPEQEEAVIAENKWAESE